MRALALLLVALAAPAAAQEAALGVWSLPEGAVVESVSVYRARTEWQMRGRARAESFTMVNTFADTSHFRVDRVEQGQPVALTWTQRGTETEQRIEAGHLVYHDRSDPPAEGHPVAIERTAAGWRYHAVEAEVSDNLGPFLDALQGIPPDLLIAALDRTVQVGEMWEVPQEVQRLTRPELLPDVEQTFRIRLDSVGTHGGGPAAFLTFDADQRTAFRDGEQRIESTGGYVHRLDLGLTVAIDLSARVATGASGRFSDGAPMRGRFVSKRTGRFRRRVVSMPPR